jgi:hypothetical protein
LCQIAWDNLHRLIWNPLVASLMGTCLIEVAHMLGYDAAQMIFTQNQDMIQTFSVGVKNPIRGRFLDHATR